MSSARLTLLLPTRNRARFLLRALRYYRDRGADFTIMVADSSDPAHAAYAQERIGPLEAELRLEYTVYPPDLPLTEKILGALERVGTPLTALGADDDFFIPEGLTRAADFLERHPDHSLAHGEAIAFRVRPAGSAHGVLDWAARYPQRTLAQPSAGERVVTHFADYTTNWYSVQRTEELRERARAVAERGLDLYFSELALSGLAVIQGKAVRLDGLYMARQADTAKEYAMSDLSEWVSDVHWPDRYAAFRACLAEGLAAEHWGSEASAARVMDRGFGAYLSRRLGGDHPLRRPRGALSDAWARAREHPGVRRVGAKLHSFGLSPEPDCSLPSLMSADSPYHADFGPIRRSIESAHPEDQ